MFGLDFLNWCTTKSVTSQEKLCNQNTSCVLDSRNKNFPTSVKYPQLHCPIQWLTFRSLSLFAILIHSTRSTRWFLLRVSVAMGAVIVNGREFAGGTVGRLTERVSDEVPRPGTWPAVTQPRPVGGEVDHRVKDKGRQKSALNF